ncbi:alpha-(1,6)-fucosyltransferase isoform X3 [Harmonia axyridis]|nr:alpha-(1,6)-fucosyltransferase isoform X3 [Harmonia axyridis]
MQSSDTKTSERLARALGDLEALRKQNKELEEIFRDIRLDSSFKGDQKEAIENFQSRLTKAEHSYKENQDALFISPKEEPNSQYELLRRRISSNTKEFWYFIHSGLLDLQKKTSGSPSDVTNSINHLLTLGSEQKRSLLHDIDKIQEVDGYAAWRERESKNLSDLVQTRFEYLQNPSDCANAKKLVCSLNKGCGYGCQLHHVVYCFMVAYGTKRTLILKSKGWRYHKPGWEDIFQPISKNCLDPSGESTSNWPGNAQTQVVNLPIIDSLTPRPPFLPLTIPEDLSPRLVRLHGDPIVWWVGQILKYLLKPQKKTASIIQEAMNNIGFKHPIVGVHVRRTDKVGTEAALHRVDEYMVWVDEYYNQLELKQRVDKRRVYLASDEPKVIKEAQNKYPSYEIIGDSTIAKTAALSTRYSDSSLIGIILDIHMLSMSDYLVCTFSSQVCRVAYEIMQTYYPDAYDRFKSLDDIYYYGGQNAHNVIAVLPHRPLKNGEMAMSEGDIIGVAGNHWNGFSKGHNLRTNQVALYPSFKVKNKVETAKFPTYSEITHN